MSLESRIEFTKENIDLYLKELAKEYRRRSGKGVPAELILVGGASVLINYGFRNMTTDVDAYVQASSAMKDAIRTVEDKYNLPVGWLNDDFKNTASYTPKLVQFSSYYKTLSHVLTIRTVSSEYLVAMKLRSGRQYKNDLSDVLGILAEHEKKGSPLRMEQIQSAVSDLYGDWDTLPENSRTFIKDVMQDGHFEALYEKTIAGEREVKQLLVSFEKSNPGVVKTSNLDDIISNLQKKSYGYQGKHIESECQS